MPYGRASRRRSESRPSRPHAELAGLDCKARRPERGNSATEQARQSLRQCLAALRNVLGAEASEWIVAGTASVLRAPSELLASDVAAVEAACQSKTVADMERASALYRDELLTGLQIPVEPFNDWLTLERQRLLSLRLDLLQRLAV